MNRLSGCLSALAPQAKQVLLLRAGIGSSHAYTAGQVARMLHMGATREARIEQGALTTLQASAQAGGCAGTLIQVPVQDRLVSVSPALLGSAPGQSGVLVSSHGSTRSAGSSTRASGNSGASSAGRSGRGPVIQNEAVLQLRAPSTSAAILVLGAFVLLGALALLSALGRRLAAREQLAMVAAGGAPASPSLSKTALPPAAAHAPSPPGPAGQPTAAADKPTVAAEEAMLAASAAAARARWTVDGADAVGVPTDAAAEAQPEAEGKAEAIEPVAAVAPRPSTQNLAAASGPVVADQARGPNQEWLRTHRSQIALVLTAVAGGALRVVARGRRHR